MCPHPLPSPSPLTLSPSPSLPHPLPSPSPLTLSPSPSPLTLSSHPLSPHPLSLTLSPSPSPSFPDNTPEIVVKSLLEGGSAVRPVSHRHILPLIATHVSDSEMPMLLYPKTTLGTLKAVLVKARDSKRGGLVRNSSEG